MKASAPIDRRYALFALACAAGGLLLRYDSFFTGFAADDYAQLAMIDGTYPVKRAFWDLYSFSNGTAEEGAKLHHSGFYPWFAHRELSLSMFRPLASAMIWLDYRMFGSDAVPYHVHTALWWAGMVLAVAWLLGALLPRTVACVALAFFAVDESHTVPIAWLANRCAITASFFGVLGLLAYVRHREGGARALAWVSALCFTLAVGFGEYALCIVPYAAAYELWRLRQGRRVPAPARPPLGAALRDHALAAWPIALPSAAYLALRHALGQGPRHSGIYISPERDLGGFIALVLQRVPVLFADLLAAVPAEMWTFGSLWSGPLHQLGWVSERWLWSPAPWRRAHSILGAVVLLLGVIAWWLLTRKLRREEARAAQTSAPPFELRHLRWLVWGGALSVLPVVGSFPSSRVLMVPEIGAAAFLATLVVLGLAELRRRAAHGRARAALIALAAGSVLCFHFFLPARVSHADSAGMRLGATATRKAIFTMEANVRKLPLQRVVVLAAREYGTSMYIPMTRARFGKPAPPLCWTLSLTPAPHVILRESATAFRLAPMNGFAMLTTAPEELLSDPNDPFVPGSVVDLGGMTITVLETDGPRVQAIRVEADVPLEDPSLWFVVPTMAGIRRFPMPRIGEIAHVPEPVIPPL